MIYNSPILEILKKDMQLRNFHYFTVSKPFNRRISSFQVDPVPPPPPDQPNFTRMRGKRLYELTNHLGNVLLTVSDRKLPVADSPNMCVSYFKADVWNAQDYYPYGSIMPGRYYEASTYRFGYQGSENDNEIVGKNDLYTTQFRELDVRSGKWFTLDPEIAKTPFESPYVSMGDNPIWHNDYLGDSIDPKRKHPMSIFVVMEKRDFKQQLDYDRFKKIAKKDPSSVKLLQIDNFDEKAANEIKAQLGEDGYISNLVIDDHRHHYNNTKESDKNAFYENLRKGYTGEETNVLLGMCWSGGGGDFGKGAEKDITLDVSTRLDNATVYGARTEANSLSFYVSGNFASWLDNVIYCYPFNKYNNMERKAIGSYSVSSYSAQQKTSTSAQIRARIRLNRKGVIKISN